ncbi:hypothetical protein DL770_010782 [Monosporascus sp. CRB-9-2]|nr:hypothetical protein DL770_010782 [Monosporascus sp. CRB-9-2]
MPRWHTYGDFFHDQFTWLASGTVYIAIVLTAMQVGLATEALAEDRTFQSASYGHYYNGCRLQPSTVRTSIIAIHGLGTESPRTWEFKRKDGSGVVNWLSDSTMLPAVVPEARIFTYDWDANYFENAPVQTLLGHADNLLALIAAEQGPLPRPIIFVASCFGGLVLAEAINRAAQEGSPYRHVLFSTVGIVFLGTPFQGSDAARQAQWQVVVGGILGEQTSDHLIQDLEQKHHFVRQRVQKFTEIANADSAFAPSRLGNQTLFPFYPYDSCLDGFPRQGLPDVTHSGMNKFDGPENPGFKLVKDTIRRFLNSAPAVLVRHTQHRHFLVPFGRNEDFVGRESTLQQLLERIPPSANKDDCQRTAVEGLGGVGKTQVALEAAYRVRDEHPACSVFWVPAVDSISFEKVYREIGEALGVQGLDDDKADVKSLIKAALSRKNVGSWLLIVDNADDLKLLFSDQALADYLPFSRNGSILFTTRNHEAAVRLDIREHIITLKKMSDTEATKLLRTGLKENQTSDTESTARLLEFLANLPLAIKQASAYMAKTGISTIKYLSYYQSSNQTTAKLLSKDFEDRGRYRDINNPIATTWLISFNHISRDMPLAAYYLKFICFLAEKDIQISLLPSGEDELEANEAIGTLKGYAFILDRENPDSFDIHRLVRLAMRNWLQEKGEWQEWTVHVIQQLTDKYPFPEHENRMYEEAEQMHRQALELREAILGKEHPFTLGSMNYLADALYSQGKYEKAEQMYRQTLELREAVMGRKHPFTFASMNNLANALDSQGKYEEAEQMHRQALKLREEALGRENPGTLTRMNNLALVLRSQGKYEEAEQMHRQALELIKAVLGRKHPSTLTSMNNLASVLDSRGNYEEADQMHRQTLELTEAAMGSEHPDTLDSINSLASVLDRQGKYEEAEQMYRQTVELREAVLGREHPDTLNSMNNLAFVLDSQGKYEKAEQMHRQTLELMEAAMGREHPYILYSMGNLANVLRNQGKYEKAELMHRQILKLTEAAMGSEHPNTLDSMNNLALVLDSQGKYEEAEQMYRQILELIKEVLGREHPYTLTRMNNLASVLRSQGKYKEAERIFQ